MKPCLSCLAIAFALALPTAAFGQDGSLGADADAVRRVYTFLGDRLTVRIEAEAPGVLRLIRGEEGRLEVAGRAPDGLAGVGLGSELHLTALGADRVEYVVVIPEAVHVSVRLPDRPVAEVFGAYDRSATFRWE